MFGGAVALVDKLFVRLPDTPGPQATGWAALAYKYSPSICKSLNVTVILSDYVISKLLHLAALFEVFTILERLILLPSILLP